MGKIYIGAYNKNTPQFKFKKMKNGHIHMSRPNTCSLYIYTEHVKSLYHILYLHITLSMFFTV